MDRFYLNSLSEEDFEMSINAYFKKKETNPKLQLVLLTQRDDLENDDYLKNVLKTMKVLQSLGIEPHDIIVAVEADVDNQYSQNQFVRIKEIRNKLQSKGLAFGFEDYSQIWSVEEVENANAKIDKSADSLRGKNYSPLEKLLSAYIDVTRYKYKKQDITEHFSQSRSIYGVLNSDKIVCVGYASLLRAIIERNGDKNIKLYANSVACSDDGKHITGYHSNLVVYIQDPKYGIDGYYYLDPTWDSVSKGKGGVNLNYFLVPLRDIQKIKTNILDKDSSLPRKIKINKHKGLSVKTQKAIAKNCGKTYNRFSLKTLSFSSEKFSMTYNFGNQLSKNPKYLNARTLAKASRIIPNDEEKAIVLANTPTFEEIDKINKIEEERKITYEAMCNTSEPIPIVKFARALTNVLSKRCPTIPQGEVISDVNKIMHHNSLSALKYYNAGAVNSFYVNGDYYQQESPTK